jgi:catechol 2,3-dioxygenase-like lactoylglutathione lyase family enzyme
MGPALRAIDHVQLAMPEGGEAQASAFYEGLLGLARRPKPPALAARGGCWFSNGEVELHLGVEQDFRAARRAHPAVLVDGLDDLARSLEAGGHPVRFDDEVPGVRRCYVDDPFGNRIELIDAAPAPAGASSRAGADLP